MFVSVKRAGLVASIVFVIFLGYWNGFGLYLQRGVYQLSTGTNACEATTGNNSSACNMTCGSIQATTESTKLDANRNKTLYIRHHKINDGHRLGNQMFRYASLLGIARAQGREFFILPGSDLEKTFKLQHVTNNDTSKEWPVFTEGNPLAFDSNLMHLPLQDTIISGFLQSYKYFAGFEDEVRQEFIFHDSVANKAALILHDVYIKYRGSLVVGVHVRRGDFQTQYYTQLGYLTPEKSYFTKSFTLLQLRFPGRNVTFVVVSDDLAWCTSNLALDNVIIAPPASTAVHIAVLASCDHVIISSGTYSWWSGWLSGGYVIYFTGFMEKNTTFGKGFSPQDYYPGLWTGLGN